MDEQQFASINVFKSTESTLRPSPVVAPDSVLVETNQGFKLVEGDQGFKLVEGDVERDQIDGIAGQPIISHNFVDPPRESRIRLKWEDRLAQLRAFRAKHGHVDVPRLYGKDPSLGTFVTNQRQKYKRMNEGKAPSMEQSRVQQLNELGFKWVLKHKDQPVLLDDEEDCIDGTQMVARSARPKTYSWESGIARLQEFKLANGHTDVPHIYAANQALGNFVKSLRQDYKHMQKGKGAKVLNEQRLCEVQSLGFKLQVRQREPWEQRFGELTQYMQVHGDCKVPKTTPLGIWILNQRAQFKLLLQKQPSQLSSERIHLLNSIGFDWRIRVPNGLQDSGRVYVHGGRAYVPFGAPLPNLPSLPSLARRDVPSVGAVASVKPAVVAVSCAGKVDDAINTKRPAFEMTSSVVHGVPHSGELGGMKSNPFAHAPTLGPGGEHGMPSIHHPMKPAPTARSVSDDNASNGNTTSGAIHADTSWGTNHCGGMMLPELDSLPPPLPIAVPSQQNVEPNHNFSADGMMPNHNSSADMFVESLLSGDAFYRQGTGDAVESEREGSPQKKYDRIQYV